MIDKDELGLDEEFNLVDEVEIEAIADRQERQLRMASIVRERKVAYGRVFQGGGATLDDIKVVMDDLRNFCRHKKSTFNPNTHIAARLDGRREVTLRIDDYIELTVDQLLIKLA